MEISKTIKPEENAEVSEMLGYVMGQLKHNGGKWDLTDDAGKPVIFDAEKNVYIPDIMLSKDCILLLACIIGGIMIARKR